MADQSGRSRPGARHLQRRLRRLPHVLARWQEVGLGVKSKREGATRDQHFYRGLGAVGACRADGPCALFETEFGAINPGFPGYLWINGTAGLGNVIGIGALSSVPVAFVASQTVTAIIPHQPSARTTAAIFVS